MKRSLSTVILLCAAVFAFSCKTNEVHEYVKVDQLYLNFLADSNDAQEIKVTASGDYTVDVDATWVKIDTQTPGIVKVSVENYDGQEERTTRIILTAGGATAYVHVVQLAPDGADYRFRNLMGFSGASISVGGKYAACFDAEESAEVGELVYSVYLIDLATDKWTTLGTFPESQYFMTSVQTVSDDGKVFVVCDQGTLMVDIDGNHGLVSGVPAGFNTAASPAVSQISADSKIMVGWGNYENGDYRPIKWVDGVPEAMPLPEYNFRKEPVGNVMARGISANGEIIYGTTWDNRDYGMIYWDKNDDVKYVGEDVRKEEIVQMDKGNGLEDYMLVNGVISWSGNFQISPNGKWICGTYRTEKKESDTSISETNQPCFFNTETETTYIFDGDGSGMAATDDGIGFIGTPSFSTSSCTVVDIENQTELGSLTEWVQEKYGITIPGGYMLCMCTNPDVFMGIQLIAPSGLPYDLHYYVAPSI